MADALVQLFQATLPDDLATALSSQLTHLEHANFEQLLREPLKQLSELDIEGEDELTVKNLKPWNDFIFDRLEKLFVKRESNVQQNIKESPGYLQHVFFIVALAALGAFIQSNVTGPPLPFSSSKLLLPPTIAEDAKALSHVRQTILESLRIDGEAAYRLTPNIELLGLASTILTCPPILKNVPLAKWARLRIDFLHQRILSEISPTLQRDIYDGLSGVEEMILQAEQDGSKISYTSFLLEAATIHTHHGNDKLAGEALDQAVKLRKFEFALTGLLGKRTKFQQKDTSQLVVLAKSADDNVTNGTNGHPESEKQHIPSAVDLNDDTLLESISFTKDSTSNLDVKDDSSLSPSLAKLDPEHQPQLNPLDSIILLSLAASITNTNPSDGITREETLPYATRVLEGGSSNWQVYTQALLLRSRIEGYKSRTVERGLLQLQALVDQVIADTSSSELEKKPAPSTFLPKASETDSAPANQRLLYVYALCSPTRWELEAELAARWVNLGGLRSALDIYERLEMWAEVALCWAATERDDKARKIIRKQIFHTKSGDDENADEETEEWSGPPREPPPDDVSRLYCILGDIDKDPSMYETAWRVSNGRYSRAQRSLGRFYYGQKDYAKASLAFSKSLEVKQLDHGTWFAFGCALLELEQFKRAVEAFSRAVQLDHDDAESWSNLAAALLHMPPGETAIDIEDPSPSSLDQDEESEEASKKTVDPQKNQKDALKALKQAARLKQSSHRIWDNLLTVAVSLNPPSWPDILTAQSRIINLRGPTDGEKCIDVPILSALVNHILTTSSPDDIQRPGLLKLTIQLLDKQVVPLITSSAPLWLLVAKVALWRDKPSSALEAHEKAWRVVVSQPGWETGTDKGWDDVVDATAELVGAYESLGPRERTEGLGAGAGQLVAKDWKFKARSALRGIKGRGKDSWEGTKGWDRLDEVMEGLKS